MLTVNVKINKLALRKIVDLVFYPNQRYRILKAWAEIYRTAVHARYLKYAKGGWRRTKPESLRKRLKNIYGYGATMIDTGDQLYVLTPKFANYPGSVELINIKAMTVHVGYGGSAMKANGKLSIARVAEIHNVGEGYIPKRQIMVQAPAEAKREMIDRANTMLNERPVVIPEPSSSDI